MTGPTQVRNDPASPQPTQKAEGMLAFLIPAVVVTLIVVLSAVIRQEIDRMLLEEKLIEKRFVIALIAEQADALIEKSGDWNSAYEGYFDTLLHNVEMLDQVEMTYAAVYDEQLQNVSARSPSYEGSPFEPPENPEFVAAVGTNESGDLVLPFTPPGAQMRPMYLHYRWLPSDATLENRLLLVTAISKFSLNARISTWVQLTTILLVVLAFLMTLFFWRGQISRFFRKLAAKMPRHQLLVQKKMVVDKGHFLEQMGRKIRGTLPAISEPTATAPLGEILDDIQYIVQIERGTLMPTIAPFSLKAALSELVNELRPEMEEKQIRFITNWAQVKECTPLCDFAHLKYVLRTLLHNAVKYSQPGGAVRFRAECTLTFDQERDVPCASLDFTIIDEGAGIPDPQLDPIYAALRQSDPSSIPEFGTAGVGLSISYALVALMGGSIKVQSEQGKGTVFTVSISPERMLHTETFQ